MCVRALVLLLKVVWKEEAHSHKFQPEAGKLLFCFLCYKKIPQMDGHQRGGEEIADCFNLWQNKINSLSGRVGRSPGSTSFDALLHWKADDRRK